MYALYVRFEGTAAVLLKIQVSWDVTLRRMVVT
jgi:hypothetical protein